MGEKRTMRLDVADIPEWDVEDQRNATLGHDLAESDPIATRQLLESLRFELPDALGHQRLDQPHGQPVAGLDGELVPDLERYDYHLVVMPLSVLVPDGQRLVRLRLTAEFESAGSEPPVAWDLYPRDLTESTQHDFGAVGVDVGKLLTFVPVPVAGALELTVKAPLKWKSQHVRIRTSDRMSNPVDWYVTDGAVENGFAPSAIIRVSKSGELLVHLGVVGELRRSGPLGRLGRARFRSGRETYVIVSP